MQKVDQDVGDPIVGVIGAVAVEGPVASAEAIGIRKRMYLSPWYDHRLVAGMYGGLFMTRLKQNLETWDAGAYGA